MLALHDTRPNGRDPLLHAGACTDQNAAPVLIKSSLQVWRPKPGTWYANVQRCAWIACATEYKVTPLTAKLTTYLEGAATLHIELIDQAGSLLAGELRASPARLQHGLSRFIKRQRSHLMVWSDGPCVCGRSFFLKRMGFTVPAAYGRGLFLGIGKGLLPLQKPINVVVGAPIPCSKFEGDTRSPEGADRFQSQTQVGTISKFRCCWICPLAHMLCGRNLQPTTGSPVYEVLSHSASAVPCLWGSPRTSRFLFSSPSSL